MKMVAESRQALLVCVVLVVLVGVAASEGSDQSSSSSSSASSRKMLMFGFARPGYHRSYGRGPGYGYGGKPGYNYGTPATPSSPFRQSPPASSLGFPGPVIAVEPAVRGDKFPAAAATAGKQERSREMDFPGPAIAF